MILIRKVADDYGWLGNMSPYPLERERKVFRTAEALFQCLRFQDEFCIEEIRDQKSPMAAKMIAKRHKANMVVVPMGLKDLNNMNLVLGLKVEQHPVIKKQLIETGDEEILEDCSKRARGSGLFWGAALKDGQWQGENWLGKLWMKVRAEFSECN
jgi:N-glycosidase YbiA